MGPSTQETSHGKEPNWLPLDERVLSRGGWHVGGGETALGIRHLWLKSELPSMASEPKEAAAQLPSGDEIWESNREQLSQGNL